MSRVGVLGGAPVEPRPPPRPLEILDRDRRRSGGRSRAGQRGRGQAASCGWHSGLTPGRGWRGGGFERESRSGAGPGCPPTAPQAGSSGGGAPTPPIPCQGAWAEPSPSNAPPRPARPRSAAGACPQHGLARLVRAVAVGLRLRAAAPCPRPAREPPQLPSAADPPRPVHGAQQAAALPNRVSAGLPRRARCGKGAERRGPGVGLGGSDGGWDNQSQRRAIEGAGWRSH